MNVWPLVLLLAGCDGCVDDTGQVDTQDVQDTQDTSPPEDTRDTQDVQDTQDSALPAVPAPVSDVSVSVHADVVTILEVSWTQDEAADLVWIEFAYDDEVLLTTPAQAREAGEHSEVLLGIPAETTVDFVIYNQVGDEVFVSEESFEGTTGELPAALLSPSLVHYDPTLAADHPWVMGSVDVGSSWYSGPCWTVIMDRQGRIVWYYEVPDSRLNLFSQVSADGTHVLIEGTTHYVFGAGIEPIIDSMTLDMSYGEHLELLTMGFSFDEIPGGSILYNSEGRDDYLVELYPDGTERQIWCCDDYAQQMGYSSSECSVNSVVFNEAQGTVFWSQYSNDTVVEIDYETGEVVRHFGQADGGWATEPPTAVVDYQHYPNYSPDGTVIASTHAVGQSGVQYAREYQVDTESETMMVIWDYGDEVMDYASYGGEAWRLENGNTFITYGTDGALREITPDRQTAWELEWPLTPGTHLLGHFTYIHDLYALNQGPADE